MKQTNKISEELYRLTDSFLVESKDQHGNDRSLDRLNQDRHLFVEKLKSSLLKIVLEAVGDRKTVGDLFPEYKHEPTKEFAEQVLHKDGYNHGIDDVRKRMEELFK